jgi:hypothetical protein
VAAVELATGAPERLPTVIVESNWKFDPKIVTDELGVMAYVTDGRLTPLIVGGSAITGVDTAPTAAKTMPLQRARASRR